MPAARRIYAIDRLKDNQSIWLQSFDFFFDSIVDDLDLSFKGFNTVEGTDNRYIQRLMESFIQTIRISCGFLNKSAVLLMSLMRLRLFSVRNVIISSSKEPTISSEERYSINTLKDVVQYISQKG